MHLFEVVAIYYLYKKSALYREVLFVKERQRSLQLRRFKFYMCILFFCFEGEETFFDSLAKSCAIDFWRVYGVSSKKLAMVVTAFFLPAIFYIIISLLLISSSSWWKPRLGLFRDGAIAIIVVGEEEKKWKRGKSGTLGRCCVIFVHDHSLLAPTGSPSTHPKKEPHLSFLREAK